ncbi:protein NATD1-like [Toxorhynchites rutilus septentrionalis]|uniref:protein NATD1-like n=1 Tax=Toxorhynchites rutilus septentrionalis TaxID=329112 RepID=UPI0024789396|nr:protein NATD1-like [Toxorhynchites rutilus septentrionalis]
MLSNAALSKARYFTRLSKAQFCSSVLKIQHDPVRSEFNVFLNDHKAYLSYTIDDRNKRISLNHTEVPEVFRGKGVGKKLVEAAFDHASREDMQVKIVCEFAQEYYERNEAKLKHIRKED